jgi:hypothetical protein
MYIFTLTSFCIKNPFFSSSLTGKQGKPVRVFGFALACWEFPSPFSHFVWLRVSAKRWIIMEGIWEKNKKSRSQTPIKSASDSGCQFIVFLICRKHSLRKRYSQQILKNKFSGVSPFAVPCFKRLLDLFHTESYTDNGAICYFRFLSLSAIIAAT